MIDNFLFLNDDLNLKYDDLGIEFFSVDGFFIF
jgi:hypothetical protein